ncbi:MAG: DUF4416 family protein [Syntrophobacteraceae bacterium]|jgi:hypothetical protein|nr:DUF4416 family protein [Syntrophobacteraceae bacterium]
MSRPSEPPPAKLIVGLLYRRLEPRGKALALLQDRFGPLDLLTEPIPFSYTRYYEREMGTGLWRQVGSFESLVDQGALPDIKLATNAMESELACEGHRTVNLDPGILTEERLLLASGKNYTHRVYLRNGIYADLTLMYQKGAYRPFPWTYADYREPMLLHFLKALKRKLMFQRTGRLPRTVS